jgi:hypothetical protein
MEGAHAHMRRTWLAVADHEPHAVGCAAIERAAEMQGEINGEHQQAVALGQRAEGQRMGRHERQGA